MALLGEENGDGDGARERFDASCMCCLQRMDDDGCF